MDASRKIPKIKSVSGGAISPIDTLLTADSTLFRYLRGGGSSITSSSTGYRSGNDAFSSPICSSNSSRGSSSGTFGRSSSSPLSAIENLISPPVYGKTPVKLVDEDVLIMDGIFVESSLGGRVSKSISSDSGGSSSNSASSSSPGIRSYKTELCRPWEDTGQCRSGSKCQYAHGKEEIRPYFFSVKNKSQNYSPKSSTNASSSYAPKSRFIPPETAPSPTALPFRPEFKSQNQSPAIISNKNTGPMYLRKSPNFIKPELSKKSPIINIKCQDWLPSDDRIEVRLPGHFHISSSNEDVDSYIRNFLHGPSNRRRLPVFTEFCPR